MTTRTEIVAAARALLGTPYVWFARVPGHGVDCIGVPILVARACGLKPADFDIQDYPQQPDGTMVRLCDQHLGGRVAEKDLLPGDVVVVSWGDAEARHVGIVAPHTHYPAHLSIIHAYPKRGGVTEHRLAFNGFMRFVAGFRFAGVA